MIVYQSSMAFYCSDTLLDVGEAFVAINRLKCLLVNDFLASSLLVFDVQLSELAIGNEPVMQG